MHYIQPSTDVGFKNLVGDPLFFPLDGQTKGAVVVGTTGQNIENLGGYGMIWKDLENLV